VYAVRLVKYRIYQFTLQSQSTELESSFEYTGADGRMMPESKILVYKLLMEEQGRLN
jgi:hypothetical protein